MVDRVNQRGGRGASLDLATDPIELGLGAHTDAGADGASAMGVDSQATADGAVAIGESTEVDDTDAASLGDRDLLVYDGRGIYYPAGQGSQDVLSLPTDGASSGSPHQAIFRVGGTTILRVQAEADGDGGTQNESVHIPVDLTVDGDTTEVEEVVTGTVEAEDSDEVQFALDATADGGPVARFNDNPIEGLRRIDPADGELQVMGDISMTGEVIEGQELS